MTSHTVICHPDDLAEIGISSGWVTTMLLCHPDDISYRHMSSGWLSRNWCLIRMSYDNVILSSGWHTLPFLSHPDEIVNFDFPHHAVTLQRITKTNTPPPPHTHTPQPPKTKQNKTKNTGTVRSCKFLILVMWMLGNAHFLLWYKYNTMQAYDYWRCIIHIFHKLWWETLSSYFLKSTTRYEHYLIPNMANNHITFIQGTQWFAYVCIKGFPYFVNNLINMYYYTLPVMYTSISCELASLWFSEK